MNIYTLGSGIQKRVSGNILDGYRELSEMGINIYIYTFYTPHRERNRLSSFA